jgi:hypothetical protein
MPSKPNKHFYHIHIHKVYSRMQSLDLLNTKIKPYFGNEYILGGLILITILYGSYAQQLLPRFMYSLFDSSIFLFLMFLAIGMLATQDFRAAFIIALLVAVIMHNLSQTKINEAFRAELIQEGFADLYEENGDY